MNRDERRFLERSPDARHQIELERAYEEFITEAMRLTQKAIKQGDVDEPTQSRVNPHEL